MQPRRVLGQPRRGGACLLQSAAGERGCAGPPVRLGSCLLKGYSFVLVKGRQNVSQLSGFKNGS